MKHTFVASLTAMLISVGVYADHAVGGAITMTRYVLQFNELEKTLLDAQSKHDIPTLDELLAPAFEVRKSSGEVVIRKDWMEQPVHAKLSDVVPSKMVVYEIGSYAVANFRLAKPGDAGGVFIVDVWVPDADKWRLRARFESPAQ